ncbi:MAG: response regulator [Chloroflexi bacterium]|nr:response regulator [Chloroflexota bacterium]
MALPPARILVVDDSRELLHLIEMALAEEGHRVRTVSSLPAAREELRTTRPDLIIADLLYPDSSAEDTIAVIVAEFRPLGIPVLVCTAATREAGALQEPINASGVVVLHKPFDLDDLLAVVDRLVAGRCDRDDNAAG